MDSVRRFFAGDDREGETKLSLAVGAGAKWFAFEFLTGSQLSALSILEREADSRRPGAADSPTRNWRSSGLPGEPLPFCRRTGVGQSVSASYWLMVRVGRG